MTALNIVRKFLNLVAAKEIDEAMTHIASDCEYHNMPMTKVIGPAAVRAVLEPFFGATIKNELIILRELVDGDTVFTERLDRHLTEKGWAELPVAGVWVIRDGQIAIWNEYFDLATLTNSGKI